MPSFIEALLRFLRGHPLVEDVRVIDFDETLADSLEVKIHCRLEGGYHIQVWLHKEPDALDYAFQFFRGQPLLRWDNAPLAILRLRYCSNDFSRATKAATTSSFRKSSVNLSSWRESYFRPC